MTFVKYPNLAEQGHRNIELAESRMGALMTLREEFKRDLPFIDTRIGMALHVTKETGVLVGTLIAGGARVAITGCNPESTQDDVAAALAEEDGVEIWAYKGQGSLEYYGFLENVAGSCPDITVDDGCDLVTMLHEKFHDHLANMRGGCEETTTGVTRLRNMEREEQLHMPVIAVNDSKTKHLLDNYYGTGQSTWDGLLRASNQLIAGKNVVVLGYGPCGKGVASTAQGLRANVTVTEVDPFNALTAKYDGYRVKTLEEAAKYGDIFVTVTGNKHVIREEHFALMKDGATLANAGHFDLEIDLESLTEVSEDGGVQVRPSFDKYELPNGNRIYVAGHGRLVNLVAAEGHPSEVMATSFCGQALACKYLMDNHLGTGVHVLPSEIDDRIAQLQLDALGVKIDELTDEQKAYQASWREGT